MKFEKMSPEAQDEMVEKHLDINTSYDWWESIFEDAEQIGLKLIAFAWANCIGEFMEDAQDTAAKILAEHGETCPTFENATTFLAECRGLRDVSKLEEEFLLTILRDYSFILQKEHDHLVSREAIVETIEANEEDEEMHFEHGDRVEVIAGKVFGTIEGVYMGQGVVKYIVHLDTVLHHVTELVCHPGSIRMV